MKYQKPIHMSGIVELIDKFNQLGSDKERYIFLKNVGGRRAQELHLLWVEQVGQEIVNEAFATVEAENGDEIHSGVVVFHSDGKPIVYDGNGDVVTDLKQYKKGEKPSSTLSGETLKRLINK